MSDFTGIKDLSSTTDWLDISLVDPAIRKVLLLNLTGTFVGTIKIQKSTDLGETWTDCSVVAIASSGATAANPTAAGKFAADLGVSANRARVIFSAYTSGTATAKAALTPF